MPTLVINIPSGFVFKSPFRCVMLTLLSCPEQLVLVGKSVHDNLPTYPIMSKSNLLHDCWTNAVDTSYMSSTVDNFLLQ